jgi:pilus assembly protein Flp/PilA
MLTEWPTPVPEPEDETRTQVGWQAMFSRPNPEEFPVLSQLVKCRVRLQNSERGATAVEYGLMVALIAIVIIVAVQALGSNLSSLFNTVSTSV